MTPGIALLVIGGILLVSGWKGGSLIDAFTGDFPGHPNTDVPPGTGGDVGTTAGKAVGFTSMIPPTNGGAWHTPQGGASSFKGAKARELNYLAGIAQNKFGLTITATTNGNHVNGSYHYRGEAFDAAGASDKMNAFSRFVLENFGPTIAELIHNNGTSQGYAIKDGQRVTGSRVFSSVWAGHINHVHVAAA